MKLSTLLLSGMLALGTMAVGQNIPKQETVKSENTIKPTKPSKKVKKTKKAVVAKQDSVKTPTQTKHICLGCGRG